MNCLDCGFSLMPEDVGDSELLARELSSLRTPGRCYACAFMRKLIQKIDELKGENDDKIRNSDGRPGTPLDTAPA